MPGKHQMSNGRLVSEADFERVASVNPSYYRKTESRSRWLYYRQALAMLSTLDFDDSLELGPFLLPLVRDSDTIDVNPALQPTYLWDASATPWPIERAKRYDVFVGLQVLEHLAPNQREAFGEIRRVADQAIISLPYMWDLPENPRHHNITDETIERWTHELRPIDKRIVAPDGQVNASTLQPFSRILLHFKFR